MDNFFTSEKINSLSAEIDQQLQELSNLSGGKSLYTYNSQKGVTEDSEALPARQSQVIAEITNENPTTFLQTFRDVAKSDLCEEGGVLNAQWQKWSDLDNKEVINRFTAILVGLGFAGAALELLLVSVAVIVIHLGVKAFCEHYSN